MEEEKKAQRKIERERDVGSPLPDHKLKTKHIAQTNATEWEIIMIDLNSQ